MNPAYKKILAKKYGHQEDHPDAQPDNPQYSESTATPQFSSTNASSPAQNSVTHDEGLRSLLNQYNATKTVVRVSTDVYPNSKKTQKSTSIPISVVIQPSPMTYGTEEFPAADFGKNNPILRCEECRTYINPFTEFIQGGQRFKCNLCGSSNPVPNYYFSHIDANGQRDDKYRRPELNYGVYDIKAGNDYMARPPMPPIYFFVIDVSQKGVENNSLELLSSVLSEFVTNDWFWGDVRTKIGFLVYDTNVHLVSLNKKLKQPQIITLTDIENLVRLPIFDNLLVTLSESKDIVQNFITSLPRIFSKTADNGSNVFNAIRVSASILRRTGGRMYVLQSNPNVTKEATLGAAANKDSKDSKDQKSFTHPSSSRFTDLTPDMQQNFVSCNLFVFSDAYKNFVTLAELSRYLNGEAYYYSDGPDRTHKFWYDLRSSLSREYTWESVFRIRISSGWKIANKYGNFSIKSSGDLLSLPNSDNFKNLVYEFELEGDVAKGNCFYLQSALLYTTSQGERRIKVANYGVVLSGDVSEIQANIDAQAIACTLFRKNLELMYRTPSMVEVRKDLLTNARQVYTEFTRNRNPPESMYTFAMSMLGIMKHPIMLDSTWQPSVEADKANALRIRLNMLGIDELFLHFIPYLFAVHTLTQEDASYYDDTGAFVYPQLLNLNMASLSNVGVYLMDAGDALYMLVGSQVDPSVLYSLFSINSLADVEALTEELMYQNQEDPLTVKISNLINELRSRKTEGYAYLHIFKEGDRSPSEMKFYAKLIEDKMNIPSTYNVSYAEFVNTLSMPVVGNQG